MWYFIVRLLNLSSYQNVLCGLKYISNEREGYKHVGLLKEYVFIPRHIYQYMFNILVQLFYGVSIYTKSLKIFYVPYIYNDNVYYLIKTYNFFFLLRIYKFFKYYYFFKKMYDFFFFDLNSLVYRFEFFYFFFINKKKITIINYCLERIGSYFYEKLKLLRKQFRIYCKYYLFLLRFYKYKYYLLFNKINVYIYKIMFRKKNLFKLYLYLYLLNSKIKNSYNYMFYNMCLIKILKYLKKFKYFDILNLIYMYYMKKYILLKKFLMNKIFFFFRRKKKISKFIYNFSLKKFKIIQNIYKYKYLVNIFDKFKNELKKRKIYRLKLYTFILNKIYKYKYQILEKKFDYIEKKRKSLNFNVQNYFFFFYIKNFNFSLYINFILNKKDDKNILLSIKNSNLFDLHNKYVLFSNLHEKIKYYEFYPLYKVVFFFFIRKLLLLKFQRVYLNYLNFYRLFHNKIFFGKVYVLTDFVSKKYIRRLKFKMYRKIMRRSLKKNWKKLKKERIKEFFDQKFII